MPLPPLLSLPENDRQTILDVEHLRLLRLGYYLMGGTLIFCFSFLIIHTLFFTGIGIAMLVAPTYFSHGQTPGDTHPEGGFMLLIGLMLGCVMLLGWAVGGLHLWAARGFSQYKHWTLLQVLAGLNCLSLPFGTALGIATFVVLNRPSVKKLFGRG